MAGHRQRHFLWPFPGSPGVSGDGGYKYQFDLDFVRDDKVVSKSGDDPGALTPTEQIRVCRGMPAVVRADPPVDVFGTRPKPRKYRMATLETISLTHNFFPP